MALSKATRCFNGPSIPLKDYRRSRRDTLYTSVLSNSRPFAARWGFRVALPFWLNF